MALVFELELIVFRFAFLSLILALTGAQQTLACSCVADPQSKSYQQLQKTWYGTKKAWSCQYDCSGTDKVQKTILGYHKDWYLAKDEGLEGICDGLKYTKQYIPARDTFTWVLVKAESFDPKKSSSPDLKKFAKTSCQ